MTFYNSIILDENRKIVGRTHVTNLSRFSSPSCKWVAYHEGVSLTGTKLPPKLIGPHNPITLIQRGRFGGHYFNLKIKNSNGTTFNLFVSAVATVEEVKAIIEENEGIPLDQQRLVFDKKELEDFCRLADYKIVSDSTITLLLILRGGGINMKDLEGETVTGLGRPMDPEDKDKWKGYSFGLNIIGKCSNRDCKSNKIGRPPILKRGLSYCRLTSSDPLDCPACDCKTFKPANFLVAGARSAINFRKKGEIKIKSALLESPGEYPKFAKYAETNETVEYEEIEVKTTKLNKSPFFCNLCVTFIMHRSCEAGRPCGHYFHETCVNKFKNCPICRAEMLIGEAVEKLFGL